MPDKNQPAHPKSRASWKWLIPCWVLGLGLTGSLAFYLISRSAAADVVDDSEAAVWESPDENPPRQTAQKQPGQAKPTRQGKQKPDPRSPEDKLADQLVQRKEFHADKLKGLNVALPASVMKKQVTLKPGKTTLIAVLRQLALQHRVPMLIDEHALSDEGIPLNWPVTIDDPKMSLEDALASVLSPLLLKYLVPAPDAEAIIITSEIKAANTDVTSLLRRGTLVAGNSPPKQTPTAPPRKPNTRTKPKPRPAAKTTPTDALRRGRQLFNQRKYNEAIAEFNRAIKLRRRFPEAYFGRGQARLYKGDNREAADDFTTAIRLRKNYANAYASRAIANARLGFSSRARQDRVRAALLRRKKK